MKRYRPLVFLGVALFLGLVTSFLVFSWLQNEKNRLMAAPIPLSKNVQVLVSNADLSWGIKLTPEMMQLQEFPPGAIPEGAAPRGRARAAIVLPPRFEAIHRGPRSGAGGAPCRRMTSALR